MLVAIGRPAAEMMAIIATARKLFMWTPLYFAPSWRNGLRLNGMKPASQQDRLDVSMLYMSDHGESLGEFGLYLHGAPYMIAPPQQTHVPFVLWLGKDAKAAYSADCLKDETQKPQSHDNLFHSVLGMMRVETKVRDPALDLISACRLGATS